MDEEYASNLTPPVFQNMSAVENATTLDPIGDFNQDCSTADSLNFWLPLGLCITGVIGNALSFIIIQIAYRRSPMNVLLKALAIADSCYLIFEVIAEICFKKGVNDTLAIYVWHAAKIAQYSSVWHLVVIAGYRYIAVCHPFKASHLCRHTRTLVVIAILWLGSFCIHVENFLETQINVDIVFSDFWNLYVVNTIVFLLPFLLLMYFNSCILHSVWNSSYAGTPSHNRGDESPNEIYEVTKVVIAITVVFFITYWSYPLPAIDLYYFNGYLFDPSHDGKSCFVQFLEKFLFSKAQFISSSTNFFIYSVLRISFRNKMRDIFCCQKRHRHIRESYAVPEGTAQYTTKVSQTLLTETQL